MEINRKNRRTLVESLNIEGFNTAIEGGVRTGWFSKYILDHTKMKVYAVDPWEPNMELVNAQECYEECKGRLTPYGDRAVMIKGYSPQEADAFESESVDFIYIDALHDYPAVKKDIETWWKKLRRGGVISGHDFNRSKWPEVVRAVEEFCEERGIKFYLTGAVGNALASQKGDLDEYDGDEQSWFIVKGKNKVG